MSEAAPEAPAQEPAEQQTQEPAAETQTDDTDWKAEARKWEQRAKENKQAAAELEKQRKASMTEAERAVVEAEARGRTAAATEFGKRLARTEFDAFAGRRNPGYDTASALEYIDLARFVGDDGEPDSKAIQAAVERLIPEATAGGPPSLDLGARQTAPAQQDFNQILRKATGRA